MFVPIPMKSVCQDGRHKQRQEQIEPDEYEQSEEEAELISTGEHVEVAHQPVVRFCAGGGRRSRLP